MSADTENSFLLVTAFGKDRRGLAESLVTRIADSGGNIEESRMTVLGGRCSIIILLSGPWHGVSRLETQLPQVANQLGLDIELHRVGQEELERAALPYSIELSTRNQPGVVRALTAFFTRNGINIEDIQTTSYAAPHTGIEMCTVLLTVSLPENAHIATLRGDFFDYCDELNLDATFEPVRG